MFYPRGSGGGIRNESQEIVEKRVDHGGIE